MGDTRQKWDQGNTHIKGEQGSQFFLYWIIPIWPKHAVYPTIKKKNFLNPLSPPARPLLCDPFNVQTPQKSCYSYHLHFLCSHLIQRLSLTT